MSNSDIMADQELSTENNAMIQVEVVYALPSEQKVFQLVVTDDTTIQKIIEQSGVLETYPAIDLSVNKVGVFSRMAKLDALVRDQDRIEIYRPLLADPKDIRRKRADQKKAEERKAIQLEKTEQKKAKRLEIEAAKLKEQQIE